MGNVGMLMDYESGEKDGFQSGSGVVLRWGFGLTIFGFGLILCTNDLFSCPYC